MLIEYFLLSVAHCKVNQILQINLWDIKYANLFSYTYYGTLNIRHLNFFPQKNLIYLQQYINNK